MKQRSKNSDRRVNSMSNKTSVGIDLADEKSVATMFSPVGDLLGRFSFPTNEEGFSTIFSEKVPKDARIGFEACTMAYPVSRTLRALGYNDITVAHPRELTWIVKSKKKNDRVDSEKIARLLMSDMLPKSYLLTREAQIQRDLLIQRVKSGVEIRKIKTSIINYLKREGIYNNLPKTSNNFSVTRRKAIEGLRFGDDRDVVMKMMLDRLKFHEMQCAPVEDRIRALVKENDDVRLLMTIPGVDFYLATLISSYVRDVNRFPSFDHLASFFGIIPVSRDSANVRRRGRMSKDGPAIARWALGVMTDTVMRRNENIHNYYNHEKDRTKSGSYAHVLTMKKLLRMVYHILKTREHWRWEDVDLTNRKLEDLDASRGGAGIA